MEKKVSDIYGVSQLISATVINVNLIGKAIGVLDIIDIMAGLYP